MMKRLSALLLALAMMLSVSAVFAEAEEGTVAAAAETEAQEPVLLVTVNGEEILSDDLFLNSVLAYYMEYAAYSGYDTSEPDMLATIRLYSMEYTVHTRLIHQKAAELGFDQFTDEEKAAFEAEARAEWAEIIDQYVAANVPEDASDDDKAAARADALAGLLEQGYDEEQYVSEYVQKVVMGIRAEAVMLPRDGEHDMEAVIDQRYTMGKEELAFLKVGNQRVRVYLSSDYHYEKGETILLKLRDKGVCLFDMETGDRI